MGTAGVFVTADVTCEAHLADLGAQTMTRFGRLDVAFNNAGFQERRAPLAAQTDDCQSAWKLDSCLEH